MIGVTLFGLIFTPVFYVVTRWSGARAPPHSDPGCDYGEIAKPDHDEIRFRPTGHAQGG
jgi:hypothetical protein